MHGKWFAAGALATAATLAFALPVRAGDTHRLSMPSRTAGAPTLSLVNKGEGADTLSVHGRGGYGGYRGGYGGYRGGYGGYRGFGYSRGYYGGYRGFGYSRGYYGGFGYYPGFYRRYYGYGYYPGYAYGAYYQPYYYSTPSPYYYSTPSYSVDPYPCLSAGVSTSGVSVSVTAAPARQRQIAELVAAPRAVQFEAVQPDDQTFPYDGGPRNPAPMPKAEPAPQALPVGPPVEEHPVSLPAKVASKLVYPAYGEQLILPTAPHFQERGVLVKGEPIKKLTK